MGTHEISLEQRLQLLLVDALTSYGTRLLSWPPAWDLVARQVERHIRTHNSPQRDPNTLPGVLGDRTAMWLALLRTAERAFTEVPVSRTALRGVAKTLLQSAILQGGDRSAAEAFRERHGTNRPAFLVISPG